MKPAISDLWRWDGDVGRGTYAFWGVLLAGIKYNLDRALAAWFGLAWTPFSYVKPGFEGETVTSVSAGNATFYGLLVLLALPFLWSGAVLTIRRLRTLHLPAWGVAMFFVPVANLFFFLVLALAPDRQPAAGEPGSRVRAWLDAFIPRGALGSASLAILATAAIGLVMTVIAVNAAGEYGWGLFVGLPFLLGLNAALIHGWHERRSLASCLLAAELAVGVLGVGLMTLMIEGVICLAMAAPIGLLLAGIGAVAGWALQRGPRGTAPPLPPALGSLILVLPLMMGAEARDAARPPLFAVVTTVEVDAPPAVVWEHVVKFSELPPPEGWIFKLGVAYPVRARIEGEGPGAVRKCEFSTGPFVEPITVWDAPRRLAFDVVAQPRPMAELSPYAHIDAPHLDDFLRSERGQFLLTALPGNRTRLAGTTWYRHQIWPALYWKVWSDAIIHGIHERGLEHVKALSEGRRK